MNPDELKRLEKKINKKPASYKLKDVEGNHDEIKVSYSPIFDEKMLNNVLFSHEHPAEYSPFNIKSALYLIKAISELSSPAVKFAKDPLNKKGKKNVLIDPASPDENYPVKCYFNKEKTIKVLNEEKSMLNIIPQTLVYDKKQVTTTVLMFSDGTKIKLSADAKDKKTAYSGIIIGLARKILGKNVSINNLYEKFKTDDKTEAMLYGVVMGYFVSKGIVKDAEMFDKWIIAFMTSRTVVHQKKIKNERNLNKLTVAELMTLCKEKKIVGYSKLKKAELIAELQK